MTFTATQSRAHTQIAKYGAAVTFSYATAGTYTESTDVTTGSTTATIAAVVMRVRGNPKTYANLSLVESEAPTLLCAFDTYGDLPPLGATVVFGGLTYTVRDIGVTDPDGAGAIIARCVVAR